MFTNRRSPILDIAALKWVMRQKLKFQDGVARFPLMTQIYLGQPDFRVTQIFSEFN